MSNNKYHQQLLTSIFEQYIEEAEDKKIKYRYFDQHQQCQDYNFENLNREVAEIRVLVHSFQFFGMDNQQKEIMFNQNGVVRINCLDCLDRTNLFMMKVAVISLENIFRHIGTDPAIEFGGPEVLNIMDDPSKVQENSTLSKFKHLWADCGDYISQHYAGTKATTTQITKTGKAGILEFLDGGIQGIQRFYVGNFEDNFKQQCIDLILGKQKISISDSTNLSCISEKSPSFYIPFIQSFSLPNTLQPSQKQVSTNLNSQIITNYMSATNKSEKLKFPGSQLFHSKGSSSEMELNVYLLTWNINAFDPATTFFQISGGFKKDDFQESIPDIIAIAFQDLVSHNTQNVVNQKNELMKEFWLQVLLNNTKKLGDYVIVAINDMAGILLVVFVNKSILETITDVIVDEVKFQSQNGKGAVAIHLKVYGVSVSFINCHLPSGEKNVSERVKAIEELHDFMFEQYWGLEEGSEIKVRGEARRRIGLLEDSSVCFLMGDLNFRVEQEYQEVVEILNNIRSNQIQNKKEICQSMLSELLEKDQLLQCLKGKEDSRLEDYFEISINFLPTYKFDQMTDQYDTSLKRRTPSWTDRILFRKQENVIVEGRMYTSLNQVRDSDHRPVVAYFNLKFLDPGIEVIGVPSEINEENQSIYQSNDIPLESENEENQANLLPAQKPEFENFLHKSPIINKKPEEKLILNID